MCIRDRILTVKDGCKKDTEEFYDILQNAVIKINRKDVSTIAGDNNTRVGNCPTGPITVTHGEITENGNGRQLIDFPAFNNFWITKSFFPHKEVPKCSRYARGY